MSNQPVPTPSKSSPPGTPFRSDPALLLNQATLHSLLSMHVGTRLLMTSKDETLGERAAKRTPLSHKPRAPFVTLTVVDDNSFGSNLIEWGELSRRILTVDKLTFSSIHRNPMTTTMTASQPGASLRLSTEP